MFRKKQMLKYTFNHNYITYEFTLCFRITPIMHLTASKKIIMKLRYSYIRTIGSSAWQLTVKGSSNRTLFRFEEPEHNQT